MEEATATASPPRRNRPHGRNLTVELVTKALRATAGIRSLAADRLGVTRGAITHFAERYPEIVQVEQDIREEHLDLAEGQLLKKLQDGDPTILRYYLDQHGAGRGYGRKVLISTPPGQPIETKDVTRDDLSKLSKDELRALRAIRQKLEAGDGNAST